MTDPVRDIAQAAATRLANTLEEPALPAGVGAALDQDSGTPQAYADPVSIASLIVAIVSLAWSIYAELRRSPRELADDVRAKWACDHEVDETTGLIIDVVAEEAVKYSER